MAALRLTPALPPPTIGLASAANASELFTYAAAQSAVWRSCNSYECLRASILYPNLLGNDWLKLIGHCCSTGDEIWPFADDLRKLLETTGPLLPMMIPEELRDPQHAQILALQYKELTCFQNTYL